MSRVYGGIDPSASPSKPSGFAAIDREGRLLECIHLKRDDELLEHVQRHDIHQLAIDAPAGLPLGMNLCCLEDAPICDCPPTGLRRCERELQQRGLSLYPVTKKSFAKAWIRRGLLLYLRAQSMGVACDEVYPSGSKRRLFEDVKWIKPKSSKAARAQLQSLLIDCIAGMPAPDEMLLSDHQLDAALAAYSLYLFHERKRGERLGDPREGRILLP